MSNEIEVTELAIETAVSLSLERYETKNISVVYTIGADKFVTIVSQSMIDTALRLRVESKTDRQIAREMQISTELVICLITEGIRSRVMQSPEEIRRIELDKFDFMEQKVLTVVASNEGPEGSPTRLLAAIDRLLKISENRRKLLGIDAPQVVEHTPLEVKINGINVDEL